MSRNKGFTLVELLAVITLLAIMAIITVPTISNMMSKQKEKLYYDQLNQLIRATQNWATDNTDKLIKLPAKCGYSFDNQTVTLDMLKKGNNSSASDVSYLDDDFINPKTDEPFSGDVSVSIFKNNKNYLYCVNSCETAKYDEYKDIASSICCDGQNFKERLEACRNS